MSVLVSVATFVETYSTGVIAATISAGFAGYMVIQGQVATELPNIVVRHSPVVSPLKGRLPGRIAPKQWSPEELQLIGVDQIITGSLPEREKKSSSRAAKQDMKKFSPSQADGTEGRYVLRVATQEIALVEGRGKLWSVKPGGLLPGSGRILKIEQRDDKWVVVTTHGEIN
ncbi:hypothetical protein MNBD_ALPHA08-1587 [hydrothermal vent metagenome]|uniref:Uncharacterized protein n=1 Tax=hydrothermal vent metagenome TaxID=652676 RepID=A0A3B0R9X1_9ZZZZ